MRGFLGNKKNLRILMSFALIGASLSVAQAAVVTTPAGLLTGPADDALATNKWTRVNVRAGSTEGITVDYPRSGNASGLLTLADGVGKADWQYVSAAPLGKLSEFTSGSYDWYRDSGSTVAAHFHPVYRLIIDIDGDPATTDIAYLIYEKAYQPGFTGTVPAGAWTSETINDASIVWVSQPGQGIEKVYNRPLSAYKSGSYTPTAGWKQITGNSLVLGVSVGIGSGWAGTFRGAVDNIGASVASTLGPDNFEIPVEPPVNPEPPVNAGGNLAPVPALDLWSLLSLGALLGGMGAWRRRKSV